MSERIRQAEFARRCNVARSTVWKWIKAGRLTLGDDGLLDADEAMLMREVTESPAPHHQARKAQIDEQKAEQARSSPLTDDMPAAEQIGLKLKFATMKEREAKADVAAMERDKMAGNLVERKDVDFLLNDFGYTLRGLMESLPDRLAHDLAGYRGDVNGIHAALEGAARELMEEVSDHMRRKSKQMNLEL